MGSLVEQTLLGENGDGGEGSTTEVGKLTTLKK